MDERNPLNNGLIQEIPLTDENIPRDEIPCDCTQSCDVAGEYQSENEYETVEQGAGAQPAEEVFVTESVHIMENPDEATAEKSKKTRKKRKKRGVLGYIAVALVCGILGSVGGGMLTSVVLTRQMNERLQLIQDSLRRYTDTGSNAEHQDVSTEGEKFEASELKTNVGDKSLTPTDVYAAYVDSTVAIAKEGTVTNYFGQVSATASVGTGFIITEDGYIVTNYHVIQNAEKLTITLNNGERYEASVVGFDSSNEVALIKIDATGLHPVSIGNSDELLVGETVCAIGNPLGELTNTLTIGVVSALDRSVNTDGTPINMMQTDCAINSGNSGGPLFDMNGNCIGITTAKYYGESIEGIGFAVPINDAMNIVADLMEFGYVTGRAYMGITVLNINEATAEMYRLPMGVFVNTIEPGSCSEKAGLMEGDIILSLGQYEVHNMTELRGCMKNFSAGDTTDMVVYRSGDILNFSITFDEKKDG